MITKFKNLKRKPKFEIGDYVYCINTKNTTLLKKNFLYKISGIFGDDSTFYIILEEFSDDKNWFEDRFRKASELELDVIKYNL